MLHSVYITGQTLIVLCMFCIHVCVHVFVVKDYISCGRNHVPMSLHKSSLSFFLSVLASKNTLFLLGSSGAGTDFASEMAFSTDSRCVAKVCRSRALFVSCMGEMAVKVTARLRGGHSGSRPLQRPWLKGTLLRLQLQ